MSSAIASVRGSEASEASHQSTHELQESSHGAKRAAQRPVLSVWAKEDKPGKRTVSGNLDIDGDTFAVVFNNFDNTLESLGQCGGNQAWRSKVNLNLGTEMSKIERVSEGFARYTTGALHDIKDKKGYKAPIMGNILVLLKWEHCEIVAAALLSETFQGLAFKMMRQSHSKGPYFKGYGEAAP